MSEGLLAGIVESAMDAIVVIDEGQKVILFNAAAERIFQRPRATVIGQPLDLLIPERFRRAHRGHVEHFGQTGVTSRTMGLGHVALAGLRASGEEFPMDASISQHREHGRTTYTAIVRDVTRRVRDEEALKRSREEIRSLAMAATTAREQEKSRIARELHDELGQALTALKIDLGWLREKVGGENGAVGGKLSAMQALIDSTVAAARRISADLRPLMLDDLGLAAATDWLVQNFSQRTGIACALEADERDLDLQDPYATAVFRVLQESLTNIAKHAGATQVAVRVERREGGIALEVRDNGRGFVVSEPARPGSFGLLGLRERASLLGGELSIDSTPGQGTIMRMSLPL